MAETQRFDHGRLSLEIPGDWHDQTTLTFISPLQETLAAPLAGKPTSRFRANLAVSLETGVQGGSAREFAESMHEALKQQGLPFDTLDSSAFVAGPLQGWSITRRLDIDGTLVRQLTVVLPAAGTYIVATASVEESSRDQLAAQLQPILSSIRFEA